MIIVYHDFMTYRERYSYQLQKFNLFTIINTLSEPLLRLRWRVWNVITEERIWDWDGHIVADRRWLVLIHPHIIDRGFGDIADDLLQYVVAGNGGCVHRHRVMLHERIAGYIRHSHTLRCVIIQHPIGRERVLPLLGRVSSFNRTVTVIH